MEMGRGPAHAHAVLYTQRYISPRTCAMCNIFPEDVHCRKPVVWSTVAVSEGTNRQSEVLVLGLWLKPQIIVRGESS